MWQTTFLLLSTSQKGYPSFYQLIFHWMQDSPTFPGMYDIVGFIFYLAYHQFKAAFPTSIGKMREIQEINVAQENSNM
jgi:hypothetical protein